MISSSLLSNIQLVMFDFDGVFTDNTVIVDQDGKESVRCWRSDGIGLQRLKEVGIKACIVSTEQNPVVMARAQKLQIDCWQNVADKEAAVIKICTHFNVPTAAAMFVGNDINDIPAFKIVGLPVGVSDCSPEIIPFILFRTKSNGGLGAVRELCDLLFAARKSGGMKNAH